MTFYPAGRPTGEEVCSNYAKCYSARRYIAIYYIACEILNDNNDVTIIMPSGYPSRTYNVCVSFEDLDSSIIRH